MSKYTSKPVVIEGKTPEEISERFADLTKFQDALSNIPEEDKAKMGSMRFEPQSVAVVAPQIGELKFTVIERTDRLIRFMAEGSPIPMEVNVKLEPKGNDSTTLTTYIEIEIPLMLRPLIGGAMQKAVDKFSDVMVKISSI